MRLFSLLCLVFGSLFFLSCDSGGDEAFEVQFTVTSEDGASVENLGVGVRPCLEVDGQTVCTLEPPFPALRGTTRPASSQHNRPPRPKPSELIQLDAEYDLIERRIRVTWSTLSETNVAGFYVETRIAEPERSFERVLYVEGQGTTTQTHDYDVLIDPPTSADGVEVRLTQVDIDGSEQPTRPVYLVVLEPGPPELFASRPNPSAGQMTSVIHVWAPATIQVEIRDLTGELVQELVSSSLDPGAYSFLWDADAPSPRIPGGVYALHLTGETEDGAAVDTSTHVALMRRTPVFHSLGATDAGGRLTISDRVPFSRPQVVESMPIRDANGNELGRMTPSRSVLIQVTDPTSGRSRTYERTIPRRGGEVALSW